MLVSTNLQMAFSEPMDYIISATIRITPSFFYMLRMINCLSYTYFYYHDKNFHVLISF